MSWSSSKKKHSNAQAATAGIDRMIRCEFCSVGNTQYGEKVGTPMIIETVRLIPNDVLVNGRMERSATVDIGTVLRCPNEAAGKLYFNRTESKWIRVCEKPPTFRPNKEFENYKIDLAKMYGLLRACHGVPSFYIDELETGKLRHIPLPANIAEVMRPKFNEMPKPIAQEPLPQEVMF